MCPQQHLSGVETLTALKSLTLNLRSHGAWHSDVLEPLQHLTALTHLHIKIEGLRGPLLLAAALNQLTQLSHLYLEAESPSVLGNQDHHMQTVSQLSQLQALELTCMVKDAPAELAALEKLKSLYLGVPSFLNSIFVIPACLTSCSNLSYISLSRLSRATLKGWWGFCTSLMCLPALDALTFSRTNLAAVSPAAWVLSTRLTFLNFHECQLKEVPNAACQLPSLHLLRMCGTSLARLAPGPYLRQLNRLTVHCDQQTVGSDILADASQLEYLRVTAHGAPDAWTKENLASIVPAACQSMLMCRCHLTMSTTIQVMAFSMLLCPRSAFNAANLTCQARQCLSLYQILYKDSSDRTEL